MDEVVQFIQDAHSRACYNAGAKASGTAPGACLGLAISVGNGACNFIEAWMGRMGPTVCKAVQS